MWSYIWPVLLIVGSNLLYQICAKSMPANLNLFASLALVFLVGTFLSFAAYYVSTGGGNIVQECYKANMAPLLMGVSLIMLESGFILAFRNGWPLSLLQIVQTSVLAVLLIVTGYVVFHEPITWQKVAGIVVILLGMGILNWK